jgi:hypothetical protein
MSIIINDFEVVAPPPAQNRAEGEKRERRNEQAAQPAELRPLDLERILRRQEQRRLRLRAD